MISIDPGVDYYALARWCGGGLDAVNVYHIAHRFPRGKCIMERPRIRRFGKRRAPDETVISLAISAGRLADRHTVEWVDAGEWTHGQSKKQRHPRILAKLTPAERALVLEHSKKNQDHILDAVGIGLWWLEKEGIRTCSL